jgi:hypothetical protein
LKKTNILYINIKNEKEKKYKEMSRKIKKYTPPEPNNL